MIDPNQLLGMLMQGGMSPAGERRVGRAVGGGSPLLDAAMQMLGGGGSASGASGAGGASTGGGAGGLAAIASGLLGGGQSGGGGGGLAALAGRLLGGGGGGGGGGAGGTAAGMSGGGLGLLGGLAGAALQQFGGGGQPGQSGANAPGLAEAQPQFTPRAEPVAPEDRALVMIRAMLSAAKADGQIDRGEQERIIERLQEAGADDEARAFIAAEMAKPADVDAVVAGVDSPHMAVEVYTASLFAIEVDTQAEARYMGELAAKLGLDRGLVRQLHESLEAPYQ